MAETSIPVSTPRRSAALRSLRPAGSGNVTLSNGEEAAESQQATYEVATGIIEMEGDVLLTQGQNALSSQSLRIDLNAGTGTLQGRVQTIFTPRSAP